MKAVPIIAAALLIGSCGQRQPEPGANNRLVTAPERNLTANAPSSPPRPLTPTVDPKSNAAAEDLVRGFVRLLNAGRFNDAYMLLGPSALPRSAFDQRFARYSNLSVVAGKAGDQGGAAGSIYVSVPLTVDATVDGKRHSRSATAVLRRVNDVAGSTEAQRHWHIERIDWKDEN